MEIDPLDLGKKIKRYRLINDIRQEDMAEKMGVSRATLINYEKGYTAINIDVLNRLKAQYKDFEYLQSNPDKPQIIDNNSIDFRVLSSVLYQNKLYIFLATLIFSLAGLSSTFLFKKYYMSEITLYPAKNEINKGLGQFQSLALNLGLNELNNEQNFNISDVVKSRLIANKSVIKKVKMKNGNKVSLVELWEINKPSFLSSFYNTQTDSTFVIEKAIKKFSEHVKVSEDRISGLIKIQTTFQDPYVSAGIANYIGSQVEEYIQKENSAQSKKEKLFIMDRLLIVKNELENAEKELKYFKERNRGYEDSPELFMLFSQLFRETEAKKQVYMTLQQQLELARIEEVKQSPILHILDKAVPPINKSSPRRALFLFISGLIGLFMSSVSTVMRY